MTTPHSTPDDSRRADDASRPVPASDPAYVPASDPAYVPASADTVRTDHVVETAPPRSAPESARAAAEVDARTLRDDVHRREKDEFGGMKFGTAFFGWLTAMGTTVLLTALAAAIGAAIGLNVGTSVDEAADQAFGAGGIVAIIVIGLVLLVSYFAGGYVAGRMARFSGAKQGIAVWIWAIAVAIILAIVTAIAGSQWDILGNLQGFPRIPVTPETATVTGILTAVGAAIVTLVGAILGGLAGMRYHRKVDRVGLGQ